MVFQSDILELIPNDQLSSEQKALIQPFTHRNSLLLLYKLLREPTHFDEIDWNKYRNAVIWRENGTLICDSSQWFPFESMEKRIVFYLPTVGRYASYQIHGINDTAIAETATFFVALKQEASARLTISIHSTLQGEQLAQILDANPRTQHLDLRTGISNTDQAAVLATRPYPMKVYLYSFGDKFSFKDNETAFVDALQRRQSLFGSLNVEDTRLSKANLRRLFQVDRFDKLSLGPLEETDALLSLSVKANALSCQVKVRSITAQDFDSVDIVAKDLRIALDLTFAHDWVAVLVSLMNRLAGLGHFERLEISADLGKNWDDYYEENVAVMPGSDDIARVTDAIISAVNNNRKLAYLDLHRLDWLTDCTPQLRRILVAMEGHAALHSFIVLLPDDIDCFFSDLEQLLSRNRKIAVLDNVGEKWSNGSTIDNLYLRNCFYDGSAKMAKQATSTRPLLIATALLECASLDFKKITLLLSLNTDVVCEFIERVDFPDDVAATGLVMEEASVSTPPRSHRSMRVQP